MNHFYYQLCETCEKPLDNKENRIKYYCRIAGVSAGFIATGGLVGGYTLPMLGFGSAGVTQGSLAAFLQAPDVAAQSVFAIFQSLGATGAYAGTFKTTGAVLGAGVFGKLYKNLSSDWCSCDPSDPSIKLQSKL